MLFRQLYDQKSGSYSYLVADLPRKQAILIDPVLEQVERDILLLKELGLTLRHCLETHLHADHVTGSAQLRQQTGCQTIAPFGSGMDCADLFLQAGEILEMGEVKIEAIATPGHTDSHLAYLINGTHLLTGDALLIRGCGRTDFPGGDAGALFDAVTQNLFTLPDETLVFPGHDYKGQTVSTIGEEKLWNARFSGRSRAEFIELMDNLNLPNPQQMPVAIPANKHCGQVA